MANCAFAACPAIGGFSQPSTIYRKTSQIGLVAARSVWNGPLLRTALRTEAFKPSIALVVSTMMRISAGKARDRITDSELRRQLCATDGDFAPHSPASKASSSRTAVSDRQTGRNAAASALRFFHNAHCIE